MEMREAKVTNLGHVADLWQNDFFFSSITLTRDAFVLVVELEQK